MTSGFAVLFWVTLALYALVVGVQIFGQVFRKDRLMGIILLPGRIRRRAESSRQGNKPQE